MSWFSENKFTAIFSGATVAVAGALGWLVIGAKGDLDSKKAEYADTVSKLGTLQGGKPFPNDKSVTAYKAELARVEGELTKLQTKLVAAEFPLEDVRPNAFQTRLKEAVDKVKSEALAKKIMLPGQKKEDASALAADTTFNLGFSIGTKNYLDTLPQDEASSEMARELKVIEFVAMQLINNGALQILEIKRSPLAQEGGDKPKTEKEEKKGADADGKGKKGQDELKLVTKHKFEVKFVSSQASFVKILNGICSAQQPFIIPRRVKVKNEKPEGPLKEVAVLATPAETAPAEAPVAPPTATPAPTPGVATPAPAHSGDANKILWVVGEENLEIELELEMIDFAEAKVTAEAKPKTSK
jgi:hypothetical protein